MIVAVCGGKGGVGKSTVALNLGHELDAVVIDADLSTPDLPWGRGPDLHDVLAGKASAMDAVHEMKSVKILPCGRSLAGAKAADLNRLAEAASTIERQYGRAVIDCPAGLATDTGYQLFSSEAAVLVTRPTKPALAGAMRTYELAQQVETPVVGAVVNMASEDDDVIAERFERKIGAPTELIEKRSEVAESQRRWLPVRQPYPDCPANDAIENIAEAVIESELQLEHNFETID